ncbi:DUF1576 domain-containing protein [Atopococcus tabaci]|uniref:DUF1576 domain-containing protein n=1 Tax=Atopococcus tabaci TaxID=269774 RepID=UPI00240A8258|nr:DUF1576 domain-containing protein [Atopococcus tabaci]
MKVSRPKKPIINKTQLTEQVKHFIFVGVALYFIVLAFVFNSPQEILHGQIKILVSPANLLTDYFALTNIGAALFNSGLMILHALATIRLVRAKINGPVIAAILTVAGFSLFGKNLYNSMPIVLGALLYAIVTRVPAEKTLLAALFGTALGPLVSEISFNIGLPLPVGILTGWTAGMVAGFLIPPLAASFVKFTKGFSLYNVGFTSGIIGTVFVSFLRGVGVTIEPISVLSSGNNIPFELFLSVLFIFLFLMGYVLNGMSIKGYKNMLEETGQLSADFVDLFGFGVTLMNVSLLGLLGTAYPVLLVGDLNGPVIGGIFTLAGFGAFGKHPKNVLPVLAGVTLMGLIGSYDLTSTSVIIAGLFGTTIAPISGHYGPVVGMLAGALHLSVVMNTSFLHGGVNLYNNGFAGGLVAASLVPLLEAIDYHKEAYKKWHEPVDPAEEIEIEEEL